MAFADVGVDIARATDGSLLREACQLSMLLHGNLPFLRCGEKDRTKELHFHQGQFLDKQLHFSLFNV